MNTRLTWKRAVERGRTDAVLLSKVGPETLEGWDGAQDWRRRAVLDVWRAANETKSLEGLLRALAAAHALYAADADLAVHVDECSAVLAREVRRVSP